jgi:hypothetical protein
VRGRERPGWEGAVRHRGANGAVGLGRKRTEGETPLRTELTAALMEAASFLYPRGEVAGRLL